MDNVFRFVQAGSEVSGLLGRLPSRVGYQPTLATEVASLQERIASVAGAAITAIEAVYVPADDFTDPAVTAISSHMDSIIVLSRAMAAEGIYPAVDPLASSFGPARSAGGRRGALSRSPSASARRSRTSRSCRTSSRCSASRNSAPQDRLIVARARRLQRFLTQPFVGDRGVHRHAGPQRQLADTLAGCRAILDGEADDWAESSLYMVGDLDEARARRAEGRHDAPDSITTPPASDCR